jgi:ParB family transcriptional regulator, chromosome partitioning protein
LNKPADRFEEAEADIKFKEGLFKLAQSKDGVSLEMAIKHITLNENIRDAIDHDDPEFRQLVDSIKEVGLLQFPVVTIDLDQGRVLCLAGHRRIEALRLLGKQTVKVVYRSLEERAVQKLAQLLENVSRKNLSTLELANGVGEIKQSEKYSAVRIAELMGKERKYVERLLKINRWSPDVKAFIRANPVKLNMKALFSVAARKMNDDEVLPILQKIVNPERKGAVAKPSAAPKLSKVSVSEYLESRGLSKKEREAILKFVAEMNLLPNDDTEKKGHGVPLPAE